MTDRVAGLVLVDSRREVIEVLPKRSLVLVHPSVPGYKAVCGKVRQLIGFARRVVELQSNEAVGGLQELLGHVDDELLIVQDLVRGAVEKIAPCCRIVPVWDQGRRDI